MMLSATMLNFTNLTQSEVNMRDETLDDLDIYELIELMEEEDYTLEDLEDYIELNGLGE